MKESDEYRLGRSAALRGESMAKYQSLTARMNPKKRAAFVTPMGKNKRNSHQRNQSELAT